MKRFLIILFASLLVWSTSATPTKADPITTAVVAFTSWVAAQGAVAVAIFNAVNIALAQAAVSMLARSLTKKPVPPGIKLERTLTGGAVARRGIIGFYATAGSEVCPPMSYGQDGKTPNAYLTKVIALSDVAVSAMTAVAINGEYQILTGSNGGAQGFGVSGKYENHAWIKFYDGAQTAADPFLVSQYAGYIRPWTANHVGTGVAYVIVTAKFNTEIWKGEPEVKVELVGMKMYDPRQDSTVGGSGSHRWGDPSTYGPTFNPPVMIYNILRGLDIGGGHTWGGLCTADDLPLSNWVAAMNVADENVTKEGGGTEPRYRAGYEIDFIEDEPADVIEELLKACSGSIVELGGVYKMRCGAPSLPVMFFTDDDFIVTSDQDYNPFPEINASHNSVNCVFPHPEEVWATHEAPPFKVQAYVDQDDGVDLPASLQMPSCPFPLQVQRNMRAWLQDDRRWRQHSATLGHYAWALEPLDVVSWSSARNGYVEKLFEVDAADENLKTLAKRVQLREIDPADYDWLPEFELADPVTPGSWELPEAQAVPGWSVVAWTVKDEEEEDRRPALRMSWDADGADDATALRIQVRLAGTNTAVADVSVALVPDADPEWIVSEGILSQTSYEARAQYVVERKTLWSSWLGATTGKVLLGPDDIDTDELINTVIEQIGDTVARAEDLEKLAEAFLDDMVNQHHALWREQQQKNEGVALSYHSSQIYTDQYKAEASLTFATIVALGDGLAANLLQMQAYTDGEIATAMTLVYTKAETDEGFAAVTQAANAYTDEKSSEASLVFATKVERENGDAAVYQAAVADLNDYKSTATLTFATISSLNGVSVTAGTAYSTAVTADGKASALIGNLIDNNGRITGTFNYDDGEVSGFRVLADVFSIESPGGGARFEYSNGNGRSYHANGQLAVRWGVWS